jgi:hypothetical protein
MTGMIALHNTVKFVASVFPRLVVPAVSDFVHVAFCETMSPVTIPLVYIFEADTLQTLAATETMLDIAALQEYTF